MLSIILLNYNNRGVIDRCIESLLQYSPGCDREILVVDNGSTDGSETELPDMYGDRIRWIPRRENGCSSGRNLGAKEAKGELLFFLDSDQWVTGENYLGRAPELLETFGAVGWTGSLSPFDPIPGEPPEQKAAACLGSGGLLIRRDLFFSLGGFDPQFDPAGFEDTDFSLALRHRGYRLCLTSELTLGHCPHQTTGRWPDYPNLLERNLALLREKWEERNPSLLWEKQILVLSYYNPFNMGGGHRPVGFLEEDIRKGDSVVFLFENGEQMEGIERFPLYHHPRLRLVLRDPETGEFHPVNPQAEGITSEEVLLSLPFSHVRSHCPSQVFRPLLEKLHEEGIPHIYDQMDDWSGFRSPPWGSWEAFYVQDAALRITVSERLRRKQRAEFSVIPNAVKRDMAEKLYPTFAEVQNRKKHLRKRVIYCGALWADWIDWDLLQYLFQNRPEVEFWMLGACQATAAEDTGRDLPGLVREITQTCPHVHFPGLLPQDELIPYLKVADAAILPFLVNDVTLGASPLKCYEYAAACLPTVSAEFPELSTFPAIFLCRDKEEFLARLDACLNMEISRELYEDFGGFVRENTWKSRRDALERLVEKLL